MIKYNKVKIYVYVLYENENNFKYFCNEKKNIMINIFYIVLLKWYLIMVKYVMYVIFVLMF